MNCKRIQVLLMVAVMVLTPADAGTAKVSEFSAARLAEDEIVRVMVQFEDAGSMETLRAAAPELKVVHEYETLFTGAAIEVPYGRMDTLREMSGVESVWISGTYKAPVMTSAGSAEAYSYLEQETAKETYAGQGTLIAVLDTGLDLSHYAFDADGEALGSTVLKKGAAVMEKTFVEGAYLSAKIPFAYDYGDMDTDVTDVDGHGTAMAGYAAGYDPDQNFSGAAPGAQLAVMKVYGDRQATTTIDVIFAAMEDAYVLGADVICVSFGEPCGFSYDEALETAAFGNIVENLEDAGVIVCCAAGDYGSQGAHNTVSPGSILADYADYGTIASPASYSGMVSVASAVNPYTLQYVLQVGRENISYLTAAGQEAELTRVLGGQRYSYVLMDGYGEPADYEGLDISGKIVVVRRKLDFALLSQYAAEQGAVAVIVVNNTNGTDDIVADNPAIPVILVSKQDGEKLVCANLKTMVIPTGKVRAANAAAGSISDSSSWGTSPAMTLSPNLSGIGGDVLTPKADGGYGYQSGTAMAAAEVSGSFAAVLSELKQESGLSRKQRADLARRRIYSTAEILGTEDAPISVRRQGAGLVNPEQAIRTGCYIKEPLQELGDDPEGTGVFTMTLTVKNTAMEGQTCPSERFSDVGKSDWFHESVDNVVYQGLFNGTSEKTFSPNSMLTRAQMVTVLYRMAGEPAVRVLSSFSDVAPESYYAYAVSWAKEKGIVNGVTETTFAPEVPVTREQMVTMLYRYSGSSGETASLREYLDVSAVSEYAKTPMAWAVGKGIVNSTSAQALYLSPKNHATRAEFATILTRALEQNPVTASFQPYSLVMGDQTETDADGTVRNILGSRKLDYDITFSCGDTLEFNRWTEEKEVDVTIRLSGSCRRELRREFSNGTFVEGFVGFQDADRGEDIHATLLGFFGDWEEAPVLEEKDFGDVIQAKYNQYTAGGGADSRALLSVNTAANLAALYGIDPFQGSYGQQVSLLGENPLGTEPFLSDRCALSSGENAMAQELRIGLMQLRNARSITLYIQDANTGQYYWKETRNDSRKSWYSTGDGAWQYAQEFRWTGTDRNGNALPDGTRVSVSVYASLNGERARLEWRFSCVIDSTPPELVCELNDEGTGLTISAEDNRYLAGLTVRDIGGQVIRQVSYNDNACSASHSLELDLTEIEGDITVTALDYATNVTERSIRRP